MILCKYLRYEKNIHTIYSAYSILIMILNEYMYNICKKYTRRGLLWLAYGRYIDNDSI